MTNTLRHARTLTLTHDEIPRTCFLVATHLLIFPSRAILSRCDLAFYLFFVRRLRDHHWHASWQATSLEVSNLAFSFFPTAGVITSVWRLHRTVSFFALRRTLLFHLRSSMDSLFILLVQTFLLLTIRTISKLVLLAINWYGNTDLLTLNPIRFRPCCCSRPSLLTPSLRIASLLSLFSDFLFFFSYPPHCFFPFLFLNSRRRTLGIITSRTFSLYLSVYSLSDLYHTCVFAPPPFFKVFFFFISS